MPLPAHGKCQPLRDVPGRNKGYNAIRAGNQGSGSIIAWNCGLADDLKEVHTGIREALLQEPVSHNDETSMNVDGENWWVHVACNSMLTYMTVNRRRGYEGVASADFLTQYTGISVSDCWATYNMFGQLSGHGRCCAHILRELQKVIDTRSELV